MSDKKQNEGGFAKFLYNGDTGEVLGRTGSSWAKILIFYVIFYLGLAAFFGLMLYVFYFTLKEDQPKYLLTESLIGDNPGVGFRPQPDQDKNVDSTLIWFNTKDQSDVTFWGSQLKTYLEDAEKAGRNHVTCSFDKYSPDHEVCKVDISNLGQCGLNRGSGNFGYDTGSPCVLLKLNKIYKWKARGFGNLRADNISDWETAFDTGVRSKGHDEDPAKLTSLKDDMRRAIDAQKSPEAKASLYNSVWIHCDGENPADKENMGRISYLPARYIASYYYPFQRQTGYVSPFIMIQFNGMNPGVVVNIECKAYAENIKPERISRTGSVHFEVMMET